MSEDRDRNFPLLAEYLKHLALERGLASNTCKAYAADLQAYMRHLDAKDPLKATPQSLTDYLWKLKSEKKLKASSIFRAMEALRSFYRFQISEEKISEDPTQNFQSPRLPERLPRYLNQRE